MYNILGAASLLCSLCQSGFQHGAALGTEIIKKKVDITVLCCKHIAYWRTKQKTTNKCIALLYGRPSYIWTEQLLWK